MKKPKRSDKTPLLEQAWAALEDQAPPLDVEAMEARFWAHLEREATPIEERASTESPPPALDAWELLKTLPTSPYTPAHERRFWVRFERELGRLERVRQRLSALKRGWTQLFSPQKTLLTATAAFGLVLALTWSHFGPSPLPPQPRTSASHRQPITLIVRPKNSLARAPKSPELYRHMPMLQRLELFENLELLQHLPALEKGPKKAM